MAHPVSIGGADSTNVNTQFSWAASDVPGSLLRIFTSTRGGFLIEDGVIVTCLVPSTGSFSFPVDVQAPLGSEFEGAEPIISRLAVNTVEIDSSIFYVIRGSFSSQYVLVNTDVD